jgi:hypothetical protein
MTLTAGMFGIDGSAAADGGARLSVIVVAVTAAPPASDAFFTNLRIRLDLCLAIAGVPLRSSHRSVGRM